MGTALAIQGRCGLCRAKMVVVRTTRQYCSSRCRLRAYRERTRPERLIQQAARRSAKRQENGVILPDNFFSVFEEIREEMARKRVLRRAKNVTPGGKPVRAVATMKALPFHNSARAENRKR